MFLIVMIALVIEYGISNVADILSKQITTFQGIALFIVIGIIYVVGQYFILEMIKAKNRESKIKAPFIEFVTKSVTIVNYVLGSNHGLYYFANSCYFALLHELTIRVCCN